MSSPVITEMLVRTFAELLARSVDVGSSQLVGPDNSVVRVTPKPKRLPARRGGDSRDVSTDNFLLEASYRSRIIALSLLHNPGLLQATVSTKLQLVLSVFLQCGQTAAAHVRAQLRDIAKSRVPHLLAGLTCALALGKILARFTNAQRSLLPDTTASADGEAGQKESQKPLPQVIVGSGPAGCALARSLLQNGDADTRVILLEAGSTHPLSLTTGGFPEVTTTSSYVAHDRAGIAAFDTTYSGEGRTLGGGSAVNAGYYAIEDHFWDSENGWLKADFPAEELPKVREVWDKGEMARCARTVRDALKINVSQPQLNTPFADGFLRACVEEGFERAPGNLEGTSPSGAVCGLTVNTMADGERKYAPHLLPRGDPCLEVRTGAAVERIQWSETHWGRAVGVQLAGGERVAASRVFVCGGPEASARLLLHSGVGDPASQHFKRLGIAPQVRNEGVGEGYHDHPTVMDSYLSLQAPSAAEWALPAYQASAFNDAVQVSFVSHGGLSAVRHLHRYLPPVVGPAVLAALEAAWRVLGLRGGEPCTFGGLFLTCSRPQGRSKLVLRSRNPRAALRVEGSAVTEADLRTLREHLPLLARLRARLGGEGSARPEWRAGSWALDLLGLRAPASPAAQATWRGQQLASLWHPAGGCCAGRVLDAALRVRGTANVHVCGAAAMPALPQANPQAQCYAMGHRLGEVVSAADREAAGKP